MISSLQKKNNLLIFYGGVMRICKKKGCFTILSKYNLNKYCMAHLHEEVAKDMERQEEERIIKVKIYSMRANLKQKQKNYEKRQALCV